MGHFVVDVALFEHGARIGFHGLKQNRQREQAQAPQPTLLSHAVIWVMTNPSEWLGSHYGRYFCPRWLGTCDEPIS